MKTFREIIADIKQKKFAPVYILMGEEPYYLTKITEMLERTVIEREEDRDFDYNVLYGNETSAGQILEVAGRYPMMADRQLVILKEGQSMQRAKTEIDKLSAYVERPNQSTVLAIVFKGDKLASTSAIMKGAKKNKDVVVFESAKIRDYQLAPIIKDYCVAEGIKISEKSLQILIEHGGNSLENLFSEIDKLLVAANGEKNITPELIEKNIGISKDYNNFELTNALAARDYYTAMKIVSHFAVTRSNPMVMTTSAIFSFYQKLLIALTSKDKSEASLLSALHLKSAYSLREIRTAMNSYNLNQAANAIHAIREFDTKSKGINSLQKEYELLKELIFKLLTL